MIVNFKTKSVEGLALPFLANWLFGASVLSRSYHTGDPHAFVKFVVNSTWGCGPFDLSHLPYLTTVPLCWDCSGKLNTLLSHNRGHNQSCGLHFDPAATLSNLLGGLFRLCRSLPRRTIHLLLQTGSIFGFIHTMSVTISFTYSDNHYVADTLFSSQSNAAQFSNTTTYRG